MFLKNDIEKFKQETGIKDERVDSIIASLDAGILGNPDPMHDGTTTCCATEEQCDLGWITAFVDAVSGGAAKTDKDEDVYDSSWRHAPAVLPAPETEIKGE